jgi:RNA polymerase sigma-70 factor, ECF subfamily
MASMSQIEILLPELRAYSRFIASGGDDAEDLVQDAVERALRAPGCPSDLQAFRPWMFRVIRNLHYDELRKHRVRREYSDGLTRFSQDAPETSDHVRDFFIRQAFDKLTPDYREVLFLVDIFGMKYAEAAEVMGVPNGTVMSRVSRARRALLNLVDGTDTDRKSKPGHRSRQA